MWYQVHNSHGSEGRTGMESVLGLPDPRDTLKMLRETLAVAQGAVGQLGGGRIPEHAERLGRIIAEIDRQRPLGADGKHGDRHTLICGCGEPESADSDRECARCGKALPGLRASVIQGDRELFYCHDDEASPTCYEQATWDRHPEFEAPADLIEAPRPCGLPHSAKPCIRCKCQAASVRDVVYFALRDAGEGRATAENLSRKIAAALRAAGLGGGVR